MSIQVNNITKIYGPQKALDAVTIDIRPGGITGLLGPNGAGKSTLMKILTCYIPPTSGSASVCGFDVMNQSIEVRKRVGYLPENNPLYLDLYVREFLAFVAGIDHGAPGRHTMADLHHRVDEVIELTGLGPEQHKKLGALSKGYRQRAGLAQSLLHHPEVLILDEPTSGLDPNQLAEIRNLIREVGKSKTVLLSTHIMQEVEAICDRAIIIHKGKIVADDTTSNLRHMVLGKAMIKVEFDKNVSSDTLSKIEGVTSVTLMSPRPAGGKKAAEGTLWHLGSLPESDIRPVIFQFAVSNGLTVLSMQREEQKLEEVFQELTRE
ncbi:MAG TPA: gliding motility-associated ABC transporter ATP-binding subunit GldA [Bacteroidales bacterium]|nr:gliding motility-associated ABC transporter ATP-binding subunit GldA [Bacteroidales bacterium]HPS74475.1 gliding motility-associated ABC transporter ATP-binding subunit GldA [Bacteroidales bacterium]